MTNDIEDLTCFIKMVTLVAQAEEATENDDWEQAIELYKEALCNFPPEMEERKPGARWEMLHTIGNFYLLFDNPAEADKYFAESVSSLMNSPDFESANEHMAQLLNKPLREQLFEVEGLPYTDEPYNGLVVPDALPLLQHTVHMLRPYGINLHAWMYETVSTLGENIEESAHKFLPDYLPPAEIERLQRPRKYNANEAVMLRGKDGCTYKLVAPGTLTKVKTAQKPKRKRKR